MNKHLNKLNLEVTELETQVGDSPEHRVGDKASLFPVPHPHIARRASHPDPEAFLGHGVGVGTQILFHSQG